MLPEVGDTVVLARVAVGTAFSANALAAAERAAKPTAGGLNRYTLSTFFCIAN